MNFSNTRENSINTKAKKEILINLFEKDKNFKRLYIEIQIQYKSISKLISLIPKTIHFSITILENLIDETVKNLFTNIQIKTLFNLLIKQQNSINYNNSGNIISFEYKLYNLKEEIFLTNILHQSLKEQFFPEFY